MIIEKDGFKFFKAEGTNPDCIIINDDGFEDVCEYIRTQKTKGIAFMQYTQDNINCIEEFSWVTTVIIKTTSKVRNLSALNALPNLISVWGDFDSALNLTNSHVEYIGYDWSKKGFISKECINLQHVFITGCKNFPTFWEQMRVLPNLKRLQIAKGNMTNCTAMKKMPSLERLDLNHLPKFDSLTGIGVLKATLKTLVIGSGKNIRDYMPLSELENLENLIIDNHSTITDLSFLQPLKKLKSFRVLGTKITATNLEFLEPIKYSFSRTGLKKYDS